MREGIFITFEGIEGAGKTTQVDLFSNFLNENEIECVKTVEPGGTIIGEEIRKILLSVDHTKMTPLAELLLYAASRAQHVEELIRPSIDKGLIVVCDRFSDSTLAYQGYGRGIDRDLIEQFNTICTGGLRPDMTFLLDADVRTGLARNRSANKVDRLEMEAIEFHERVRRGYQSIAERDPQRVKIIKTERTAEEIAADIVRFFRSYCEEKGYAI